MPPESAEHIDTYKNPLRVVSFFDDHIGRGHLRVGRELAADVKLVRSVLEAVGAERLCVAAAPSRGSIAEAATALAGLARAGGANSVAFDSMLRKRLRSVAAYLNSESTGGW